MRHGLDLAIKIGNSWSLSVWKRAELHWTSTWKATHSTKHTHCCFKRGAHLGLKIVWLNTSMRTEKWTQPLRPMDTNAGRPRPSRKRS